jgi:hypothetical protein
MRKRCAICGEVYNYADAHDCKSSPSSVTNAPKPVTNVTNTPLVTVTNKPTSSAAGDVARVMRWRAANPARYRTYQRDLMRRRRAEKSAKHVA